MVFHLLWSLFIIIYHETVVNFVNCLVSTTQSPADLLCLATKILILIYPKMQPNAH